MALLTQHRCLANAMTGGGEVVYDFVHQERGLFSYSGEGRRVSSSLLAGGGTAYVGFLEGFSRQLPVRGVRAYGDRSLVLRLRLI